MLIMVGEAMMLLVSTLVGCVFYKIMDNAMLKEC